VPTPIVNVNVNPTPLTVSCGGSQPSVVSVPQQGVRQEPLEVISPSDEWEPKTTDLVKQYLKEQGFTEDFTNYFGDYIEANPMLMGQDAEEQELDFEYSEEK